LLKAIVGELTSLAKAGVTFYGEHGAADTYAPRMFCGFAGKYHSARVLDDELAVAALAAKGTISKGYLKQAIKHAKEEKRR